METTLTIVHLDDSREDAELIARHLRPLNARLVYVANQADFERALAEYTPDIILSDYKMPSYDGDAAFRSAKKLHPDTPFVMVTGELGEEFVIERLRNGVTDYVLKDNLKRLLPVVERAVKESDDRRTWKMADEKFRALIETAVEGMWAIDANGKVIYANDQLARILGLDSGGQLVGRFAFDFIFSQDLAAMQQYYQAQLSGERVRFEFRLRCANGSERWALVSTTPQIGPSGSVESILALFSDITEHRRFEQRLAESEERCRSLAEHIPAVLFRVDREKRMSYITPNIEAITGISSGDYVGKTVRDMGFPEGFTSLVERTMSDLFRTGKPQKTEFDFQKPDGTVSTFYTTLALENDNAAEPAYAIGMVVDVTAEKQRLRDVQRSADDRVALLECISDRVCAIDRQWHVTFINEQGARQIGKPREEIIGKVFWDIVPALRGSDAERHYHEAMNNGNERSFEVHSKTGERIYSVRVAPSPGGIVAHWRDITEQKNAQGALAASEQKYRLLFESMTEGFLLIEIINDETGKPVSYRYLDANPALERHTNLKRADIIGKDARDVLSVIEPHWIEAFAAVASTGKPAHIEEFSAALNNWYDVYIYCPEPGKAALIYTKTTERRNALDALRRSEERFSLAQRAGRVGVFDWDLLTSVMVWTGEMEDIFGITRGGFENRYEGWVARVHPEDLPRLEAMFQEWMDSDRTVGEWEFRIIRDGTKEERWIAARGEIFRNEEGKAVRMIGTNLDITDRKRGEAEIQALNTELEARVTARTAELQKTIEDLDSFAVALGHDLKVPLRAIHGFTTMAMESSAETMDDEGRECLRMVLSQSALMSRLVDELLAFVRLGRQEISKTEVELAPVVASVLTQLKAAETPDRRFDIQMADLPTMTCNETLIRQVFVNLISNAFKFSRPMPVARIEIAAALRKDHYTFSVCDNGIGFDTQYAKKLFGLFQRLQGDAEFEGTGIGLAIVKRIVERHGGKVWADGEKGKGACFYFTLPLHPKSRDRES